MYHNRLIMDGDTYYWLNRVAIKLNELQFKGVDFKIHEWSWLFDWDEGLSTDENLINVAAEDKALTVFTQAGVIESVHKDNFFRNQQLASFEDPLRGHIIWNDWEEFDAPKREYEYLRIIDNLHWDMFRSFCNEHDINYKDNKIAATLEIVAQRPVVHVNGKEYSLKVLQSGSPLEIIEQAIAHPEEQVTFDKLRLWTGRVNAYKSQNNFKQIFRKNEFGEGNILHPFVDARTNTFVLKNHTLLTITELSKIQKASTN